MASTYRHQTDTTSVTYGCPAPQELSKRRESLQDLAPILWNSFGSVVALIQDVWMWIKNWGRKHRNQMWQKKTSNFEPNQREWEDNGTNMGIEGGWCCGYPNHKVNESSDQQPCRQMFAARIHCCEVSQCCCSLPLYNYDTWNAHHS